MDAIDIAQLSTTEFHYSGIAHIYSNPLGEFFFGNKHAVLGSLYNPLDFQTIMTNVLNTAVDRFIFRCHVSYRALIKMGMARVLHVDVDVNSFSEPVSDNGWLAYLSGQERLEALSVAQDAVREEAGKDRLLLERAESNARVLLEQYVVNTGKLTGKEYQIQFIE